MSVVLTPQILWACVHVLHQPYLSVRVNSRYYTHEFRPPLSVASLESDSLSPHSDLVWPAEISNNIMNIIMKRSDLEFMQR